MFFSKTAVAAAIAFSSLLGAVVAQPIHHAHNLHKREANPDVVVVVITNYVDSEGNIISVGTEGVAAPSATSSSAAAVVAPSSEVVVVSSSTAAAAAPSSSSVASVVVPVASSSSSSSVAAATSTGSSGYTSGSTSSAGAKGVVYSPYKTGGCKTADEVKSDLAQLTGYDVIRLYGVDCDQVTNVKAALADGQKLFLGIYDVANLQSGLETLIAAIGGDWDLVHTVSIGNELVNSGSATVDQIASYVSAARPILTAGGYSGPVVSVDTFIAVINNPGLCDISDYMAVNAHCYFDGGYSSSEAGSWTLEQIQRVWTACSGKKDVFISEAGWPWAGETNGKAVASYDDQAAAISAIKSAVGTDTILFTAFNDLWKSPGLYSIEQNFGLYGTSN
ncbi:uncharacterized protein SAPINGB_P002697 [Magnusiomyces paraingens]|uniref:Glycoside hydrolase family 17 protein n=1 Tax=Magnusiomyces paraingens TaxID=2606893 RepID=A0A5E8BNH4_9ASCO|nr:uncharacterized protein SAPINGB_P002697 [Saprochaete ingens]VVT50303.1 unnamed protein product [Saprochaete ingens]